MFNVPAGSSSPNPAPSTPDRASRFKSTNFFSPSNLSTTPAGPPPTSFTNQSTTPAGPPPASSLFSNPSYASPAAFRNPPPNPFHRDVPTFDQDDFMLGVQQLSQQQLQQQQLPPPSSLAAVARGLASDPAPLHDSGSTILSTESVLQKLWSFEHSLDNDPDRHDRALAVAVRDLLHLWRRGVNFNYNTQGIGPGKAASPSSKALFLVSLLLPLHHPYRLVTQPGGFAQSNQESSATLPEILLNWLRDYHDQYPEDFAEVMACEDGPAAHERFWDVVYSLSLRGRLKDVAQMLKTADFNHAYTALEDGAAQPGYTGKQLGNVQRVINRALSVLDTCPAIQAANWNVKGLEWATFRKRLRQALSDLETFAEGSVRGAPHTYDDEPLQAANFGVSGLSDPDFSVSRMSKRAQSQVPWAVYEGLKQFYAQLLGLRTEVVSASADWVEATIGLAVWWDGDDDDISKQSLASSRRPVSRSQHTRAVDLRPGLAYREKLALSLRQVSSEYDDAELQVNAMDPVEVGLACVFEGNVQGLLGILRGWSSTMTAAVVEVANHGSWLSSTPQLNDLDEDDLMLLNYDKQTPQPTSYDQTLIDYAQLLSKQDKLFSRSRSQGVEGWELAIQVLTRLDDEDRGERQIEVILDALNLTQRESVEKVMALCDGFNLPAQGRSIAEKYANYLAANTTVYGDALYYYSRAHNHSKTKQVLNVLITTSLVQSRSYPPSLSLDIRLKALLDHPAEALTELSDTDADASRILSTYLPGYAMLRKFYDIRDSNQPGTTSSSTLTTLSRKRHAAAALTAAVQSAQDSIHGGLYDPSIDSAIPVDGLLVLLGESLVFLNQPRRLLDSTQIFALLKAAEDLETVPSGVVRDQCEECLRSAITAASSPAEADEHLRRSLPAAPSGPSTAASSMLLSGESNFSLVSGAASGSGVDADADAASKSQNSLDASGVLVNTHPKPHDNEGSRAKRKGDHVTEGGNDAPRGWDWRRGLTKGTTGVDVLRILRLGLARELSRAWTEDDL